ncbi:kinase [Amycolatopsis sp. NPDC051373]|uniref:kinase n=1 Tax=Amycolatopsis sp. NPDC051373 TaxID=3155801 RepID=UPI00344DCA8B
MGSPRLVLLRGPSGAGKTTTALTLRSRWGRGTALIQQDVVRRHVLRERDVPGGVNIGLIDVMCRHALGAGYVPFPETVRRHATRPQVAEFTPEEMLEWYLPDDRLGVQGEIVLGEEMTLEDTVEWITAAMPDRTGRSS